MVTYTFSANTKIKSSEANQNNTDLITAGGRTIDSGGDRTIASGTPAAIGTHGVAITVQSTSDFVLLSFNAGFYSSDTSSYFAFSLGYDTTDRSQAGSQISFLAGAGEGNRKMITLFDIITGLSPATYTFKPFFLRTAGGGTGSIIQNTSVFTAHRLRS